MPRKIGKKGLDKKLIRAWARVVKKDGKCEVCGKGGKVDAHHVVGKRNRRLRYDPRNGVALCPGHHTFGTESAHQDPVWFAGWLEDGRKEDLDYIKSVRNDYKKWTLEEMHERLAELREMNGVDNG